MLGLGTGFYGLGKTGYQEGVTVSDRYHANYLVVPAFGTYEGSGSDFGYGISGLVLPETFESTIKTSFTYCAWVAVAGQNAAKNVTLLGSGGGTHTGGDNNDIFRIYIGNDKKLAIEFDLGDEVLFQQKSSSAIAINGFAHIAVTITDVGGSNPTTAAAYVNGSAITLATATETMTGTEHDGFETINQLGVGCVVMNADPYPGASAEYVNQSHIAYAGVALFDEALDAANIDAIYGLGFDHNSPPVCPDLTSGSGHYNKQAALIGYWPCADGSGGVSHTATDESTNSNDGSTAGAAVLV